MRLGSLIRTADYARVEMDPRVDVSVAPSVLQAAIEKGMAQARSMMACGAHDHGNQHHQHHQHDHDNNIDQNDPEEENNNDNNNKDNNNNKDSSFALSRARARAIYNYGGATRPFLHIVLRDFTLHASAEELLAQIMDFEHVEEGSCCARNDSIASSSSSSSSLSSSAAERARVEKNTAKRERNAVRALLMSAFQQVNVWPLPPPADASRLRGTGAAPITETARITETAAVAETATVTEKEAEGTRGGGKWGAETMMKVEEMSREFIHAVDALRDAIFDQVTRRNGKSVDQEEQVSQRGGDNDDGDGDGDDVDKTTATTAKSMSSSSSSMSSSSSKRDPDLNVAVSSSSVSAIALLPSLLTVSGAPSIESAYTRHSQHLVSRQMWALEQAYIRAQVAAQGAPTLLQVGPGGVGTEEDAARVRAAAMAADNADAALDDGVDAGAEHVHVDAKQSGHGDDGGGDSSDDVVDVVVDLESVDVDDSPPASSFRSADSTIDGTMVSFVGQRAIANEIISLRKRVEALERENARLKQVQTVMNAHIQAVHMVAASSTGPAASATSSAQTSQSSSSLSLSSSITPSLELLLQQLAAIHANDDPLPSYPTAPIADDAAVADVLKGEAQEDKVEQQRQQRTEGELDEREGEVALETSTFENAPSNQQVGCQIA